MSNQRKVRQELRQGLHQFLMQLYVSYRETHNEEDSRALIIEALNEQSEIFTSQSITVNSVEETLKAKIEELKIEMEKHHDYDGQLFYAEKIDHLAAALEVLKTN